MLILERFRQTQDGNPCEKFLALRKVTIVREYRRQFEILALPLTKVSEQVLEGNFVNGMKPEIRAEVRLMQPIGLGWIMELAQRIEDCNTQVQSTKAQYSSSSCGLEARIRVVKWV